MKPAELESIYSTRFAGQTKYRQQVWGVLSAYFSKWIDRTSSVLDLGCGHCEFINSVAASRKFAMDLNPDARRLAGPDVTLIEQDCSQPWDLDPGSLDAVFTSNFFEHLPDKGALERTLQHVMQALRKGGSIVMIGPNIKYVPGAYWDFFDHFIPLTELSLAEALKKRGFSVEVCVDRFLPYSMSQGRTYPIWMLRLYLSLPTLWPFFGKQFLIVARKV